MSTNRLLYVGNFYRLVFKTHGSSAGRTFCQKSPSDYSGPNMKSYVEENLAKAKPFEEIPKLPMIPFFGSVWMYYPVIGTFNGNKMYEADLQKREKYGDIVRERYQNLEFVTCFHPQAMDVMRYLEGRYPARADFTTIKAYREKRKELFPRLGLVAMQGRDWWDFRQKIIRPFLEVVSNETYILLHEVVKDLVNLIRLKRDSKNEVHITDFAHSWALETVGRIMLDTRLGCLDPNLSPESDGMKMIKSVRTLLDCIHKLEVSSANFPFWKYFPSPTWRKFTKAGDVFTDLAFKYIHQSLDSIRKGDAKGDTLLQRMLKDESVTTSETFVAVSDVIMAGIDTTANAACYLLYCLAKNPEKQEIAYREIMEVLPGINDIRKTERKHKYVRSCMHEALRMYPPVRGNLRIFENDVPILGYRIPAGTAVFCAHQAIYRDERFFKNPNEFMPERWIPPQLTPFSFQPFGYGKRSCLGQILAKMELQMLITEILRNFSLEYHYEDIGVMSKLINVPDRKITIRFIDR